MNKPRVRFCWNCGAKLYGNHHKEIEVDGEKKIVHKVCGDSERECRDSNVEFKYTYNGNLEIIVKEKLV